MDFKKYVQEKLKNHPKRLKHTLGVYKRAIELGNLYKASIEVLEIASLLHDVTKHEKDSYHENLIDDSKITSKYPKEMWHALSGAKLAEKLGINNNKIIEAIKYHVFGKIEMDIETMILCVSDFSEENRTIPEAREVYELSLTNLNDAYLLSLEYTFAHLNKLGIKPIEEQIETYKYYKKKGDNKWIL